jgi:hypothetical protein
VSAIRGGGIGVPLPVEDWLFAVGIAGVRLERDALMAIAAEACHAHRAFTVAKTTVDRLSAQTPAAALAPVVGQTTAAVVFTEVGDARSFLCTRAFLKAMGLNLKEGGPGALGSTIPVCRKSWPSNAS